MSEPSLAETRSSPWFHRWSNPLYLCKYATKIPKFLGLNLTFMWILVLSRKTEKFVVQTWISLSKSVGLNRPESRADVRPLTVLAATVTSTLLTKNGMATPLSLRAIASSTSWIYKTSTTCIYLLLDDWNTHHTHPFSAVYLWNFSLKYNWLTF